jgi:hypothetical protein
MLDHVHEGFIRQYHVISNLLGQEQSLFVVIVIVVGHWALGVGRAEYSSMMMGGENELVSEVVYTLIQQ